MRRRLLLLGSALGALLVAALLVGPRLADEATTGLVTAAHADCSQPGKDVAVYLATGSPTTFDPQWASTRADILGRPSDARPGLIRAQADSVISRCDQQLDRQAEAQIQAQHQAQEAAAAALRAQQDAAAAAQRATAAARLAEEQAAAAVALATKVKGTCARVGGRWEANCQIGYRAASDGQVYQYTVEFNASGDVIPPSYGPQNAAECAATKHGSINTSVWHPDTDICSI